MTALFLHARETPGFARRVEAACAVLKRSADAHPGRIVQATSLDA